LAAWTFFIGLAFAAWGIYTFTIDSYLAGKLAYNILTQWTWGWTLAAITHNLLRLVALLFNLGWFLFWNVFLPSQPWWAVPGWIGEAGVRLGTIPGLIVTLIGLGVTIALQLAAVQSACNS